MKQNISSCIQKILYDILCIYFQLKNKLRMVPSKLLKTEKDLDEYRTKYDAMMQLKPLKENVSLMRCTCWNSYAEAMNFQTLTTCNRGTLLQLLKI